jgi:hypothetical protein
VELSRSQVQEENIGNPKGTRRKRSCQTDSLAQSIEVKKKKEKTPSFVRPAASDCPGRTEH